MNEVRNIAATEAICRAVSTGDLQTVLAHLDSDVRVTYYGTEKIPYAGDYRGIEEAVTFLDKVGQAIEIIEMAPWKFIAQGDDLATCTFATSRTPPSPWTRSAHESNGRPRGLHVRRQLRDNGPRGVRQDPDGVVVVASDEVLADQLRGVRNAVTLCPSGALRLVPE